ncbi:MAG TPA: hypothetical protein VJA21_31805 [Verrucomicrobiae bacterium]
MKTLHLLLGGAERRLTSAIQTTVLDVCFNRAAVAFTNSLRPNEFVRQGCCGCYELIILDTEHLLPELGRPELGSEELVQIVWTLKNQSSTPLVVLGATAEMEYRFLEAGADAVLVGRWKPDELRAAVDQQLALPHAEEPPRRRNWSFAGFFGSRG